MNLLSKIILTSLLLILIGIAPSVAQVGINNDGSRPDSSAMLDVRSTQKGFLMPRMSESQRLAITSPSQGLIVFQINGIRGFYFYTGSAWKLIDDTNYSYSKSESDNRYKASTEVSTVFAIGCDSSLIDTSYRFPIGYSTGFVIDTVIYIQNAVQPNPSVVPGIFFSNDISATGFSATMLNSNPPSITSKTCCIKNFSFDHPSIPSGQLIWLRFISVTSAPRSFYLQILAHRE